LAPGPAEIAPDDLVTFFSLTEDDVAWLRAGHRLENHLGVAVQLCSLPWLGWCPTTCPVARPPR
jgi:hypothetical protein